MILNLVELPIKAFRKILILSHAILMKDLGLLEKKVNEFLDGFNN